MFILDCFERDMIKNVLLSKRQLGTNHLSFGYESSQLWVRIVWVRNVRGYETSGFHVNDPRAFAVRNTIDQLPGDALKLWLKNREILSCPCVVVIWSEQLMKEQVRQSRL